MFTILSKNCHMQHFTPCQNFILQHMVCNFIIALLHILTFVEQSAWSSFVLAICNLHSTWLLIIDKTSTAFIEVMNCTYNMVYPENK